MHRRKCCEEAGCRLCFDVPVKSRLTRLQGNRVCRVAERCRPLSKVSVSVHDAANLGGDPRPTRMVTSFLNISGFLALSSQPGMLTGAIAMAPLAD